MWTAILAGISTLGSALGGAATAFFGFKKDQANVMTEAIEVVGDATSSNAQIIAAIAQIIKAEANSGYWLASQWRPLLMVFFAIIIGSFWFGYSPPNIDGPMSPMMDRIFDIVTLGIGGYIPARTIEKVVGSMNVGKILKTFIEKKLG